jgi:ribosomal protein S19E (S16A)
MLATMVAVAWRWRAAAVLRLLLRRGHIGVGPLEGVFAAVAKAVRGAEKRGSIQARRLVL